MSLKQLLNRRHYFTAKEVVEELKTVTPLLALLFTKQSKTDKHRLSVVFLKHKSHFTIRGYKMTVTASNREVAYVLG